MQAAIINFGTGFDADYAEQTALRMFLVRGLDAAKKNANEHLNKNSNDGGGAEFWSAVLAKLETLNALSEQHATNQITPA